IDPGIPHHDVPLTPRGLADARALGARLRGPRRLLLTHTRFERTRRTAEALAEGFASAGGAAAAPRLLRSSLGSYVLSDALYPAGHAPGFMEDWVAGRVPEGLILDPLAAARLLLRRLFDRSTGDGPDLEEGDLFVHVAHDWDVAALRWALLRLRPEEAPPGFLEGVVLVPDGGGLEARSLGRAAPVPASFLDWRAG
ncbi:MAG: histidine phosphatase family protein, partial [Planctomycetes bacterium]|nr:histidine phosphatase family protein [Planctomycetota bacterium]